MRTMRQAQKDYDTRIDDDEPQDCPAWAEERAEMKAEEREYDYEIDGPDEQWLADRRARLLREVYRE